jgi:nitrogen regulatory protein P-II 1
MKLVVAIIRPGKLPDVKDALLDENIEGFSAFEVMGCGNQWGHTESEKSSTVESSLIRKTKVEIEVPDTGVRKVIDKITGVCRSGRIGDGKIFVYNLPQSVAL